MVYRRIISNFNKILPLVLTALIFRNNFCDTFFFSFFSNKHEWFKREHCQRATCRHHECVLVKNCHHNFELLLQLQSNIVCIVRKMDTDIVNTILRLCTEEQKCSFEISFLEDYCRKINRCWNVKYILASMKNYLEIFRINFKQNQMEFFMPVCINWLIERRDSLKCLFSLKSVGRNVCNIRMIFVRIYMYVMNILLRILVVD